MLEPKYLRIAAVTLILMTLSSTGTDAADSLMIPRIRTHSAALASLIDRATRESATFRRLIDAIETTDGIVYVDPGTCGLGVRACLVMTVTKSASHRILNVRVDPKRQDADLMGAIGHELRHALEVLNSRVSNAVAMWHFYRTVGKRVDGNFETAAAIQTGATVRQELRSFSLQP